MKLEWKRLINNACPKCGNVMENPFDKETVRCLNIKCDFRIAVDRMNELVSNLLIRQERKKR